MGRQQIEAFTPYELSTVAMLVNSVSTNIPLPLNADKTRTDQGAYQFSVYNAGPADAYIEFGGGSVAATYPVPGGAVLGSYPVPARSMQIISPRGNPDHVAAITSPGTPDGGATLYITPGAGL